jgi:RNA polymerase sigma-70 factor (ECF subfamily)
MVGKYDITNLLIRLKTSDHSAFSDIFSLYHRQIYLFCCKSLSEEDAEEITQNVFMTIWEDRQKIDPQYSFSAYLYSIAKHQVYNTIRNKVIQKSFMEKYVRNMEDIELPPEYDDSMQKLKMKLKNTINQLPERQREIFKMNRTYGLTYKEIAQKLNISENTVDTSMRRSLAFLRKIFLWVFWALFS